MKNKKILKKLLAIVLVFAMLAPIMGNLGTNAGLVQAAEEEEAVGYKIVTASDVTESTVDGVKVYTSSTYKGYVFAGWYKDEKATEVAYSSNDRAYARFLPEGVLSTKVQVTNGVVTDTANETYKGKYVMRFVSSVDSIDYKYAGFELSWTNKTTNEPEKRTSKSYTSFKRIDSATGATGNDVDTYEFSPKVIDTKSEYFITAKWPVAVEDKDVDYTVKAYWVTKDGTKVYGKERCVAVEDGATETAKTRLNLTVDMELSDGFTYTVSYVPWNGTALKNLTVEVLTSNENYSNIRVFGADKNMKSVTPIYIVRNGATLTTATYRNLYSKYEQVEEDGTITTKVDGSWYSASEDEYIISSRADMYGFAKLVDAGEATYPFTGKRVYLVSDIALNPEELELIEGDNYLKWYTYDNERQKIYSNEPTHNWNPIGAGATANNTFNGTFDGQGHTITGLYLNMKDSATINNSRFGGLFSQINETASIKDVKLKNSHLKTVGFDIGSVAGIAKGTLENVYSDAIVECNGSRSGGMVGQASGSNTTMTNCWFAGHITNDSKNAQGTGGLVGIVLNGAKLTMKSCYNTGIIDVSAGSQQQPYAGGMVGQVGQGSSGEFVLNDSFIAGQVIVNSKHTVGFGASVGMVCNKAKSTITKSYFSPEVSSRSISVTTADSANNIVGATYSGVPAKTSGSLVGDSAKTTMANLSWESSWETVEYGIPVLKAFEKEVFDTNWYDDNKSVYVLKDRGDLYGFVKLSADYDFSGKTIKLADDIIVNRGNAKDWAAGKEAPYYAWTPIAISMSFNGVFDGDMYAISGIYLNTTAQYGGLFGQTNSNAQIKELKLYNSYFNTTANNVGSIAAHAKGTFNKIYSNAIVNSSAVNVGGLIGRVASDGNIVMTECWFAGTVATKNNANKNVNIGGLIGNVLTSSYQSTIQNCLNSGNVEATGAQNTIPRLGGLIGYDTISTGSNISNCVNVGLVKQGTATTNGYGPLIGYETMKSLSTPNMYATTESNASVKTSNYTSTQFTALAEEQMIGTVASTKMSGLDWVNTWATVEFRTPVLKAFINETDGRIDVSWFDAEEYANTEAYVLYDTADLYGFTMLSKSYNFANKTVKLGSDIVVNEGTAASTWTTKSNYRQWIPIGAINSTSKKDFMGTFDGQGHTISGLYLNTTWRYAGLFSNLGSSGIIQNLQLKNSYFNSTGREFGGIAGFAAGKFYNIYNNVIMTAKHQTVGGFAGQANGTVTMDKCWFDGNLTNSYANTNHQGTGGFVGLAQAGTLTMSNCLNTGEVVMSSALTTPKIAGFIGYVNIPVTMNSCLNAKNISKSADATNGYGPLVGYSVDKTYVSISSTYVLDTSDVSNSNAINNLAQTVVYGVVTEDAMKADAIEAMPLLDWDNDWKFVSGAFPELRFNYAASLNTQKFVATDDEQSLLNNLYAGRTLYQGEMHDHASTYGRGPEDAPGDDGTYSLVDWEEQLVLHNMDFAASLDHQQIDHIDHEHWKESKFVYGTEALALIIDLTDKTASGLLHFDMIFKTKEQFISILMKYKSQFGYTGEQLSGGTWFTYDNLKFTKAEFSSLIKDVYAIGGVVNLPHPMQGPNDEMEYSTVLADFIFDVRDDASKQVIYGFQVITNSLTASNSTNNYTAWENLLNQGYRLYATAGSDRHADLNANTLTSIYANTCTAECDGTCDNEDCAAYDKGNLITQLATGDYVAGSVGIQMSIGETKMGSSCQFSDNDRLVIAVDNIHYGAHSNSSQTFRIDVMNENGVVYSQKVVAGDKIALDVDADSAYYRVAIYNVTTSVRIAVGNPIWNDK